MILTYHGGYFVKVAQGDVVIGIDPFGKNSKRKQIRFGARIALVSMNHPDMNGAETLSLGDKIPFVVSGPGEYEIGGISVSGFPALQTSEEKEAGKPLNTIYTIELEGIRLCHLGALASPELSSELVEGIGEVDILFTPVLGGDVLSPSGAAKIANTLGAKLVIPIAWDEDGEKQLKTFLKETGEDVKPIDKLTLKKKDLEGKQGDVVVLEALSHA